MDYTAQLIRDFEGYRDSPYWDVNAYRAGYGSDTMTTEDGRVIPISQGMTVNRADAERDLQRRIQTEFMPRAAGAVGQDLFPTLSPEQQAALVSITYNYGSLPGSVASAVQSGNPQAVSAAIRALGNHNDGINRDRRNREADIYAGASGVPAQDNALAPPPMAAPQPDPRRQAFNALMQGLQNRPTYDFRMT